MAIARSLSREDDDVFLAYAHDEVAARAAAATITETGARAHLIKGDIGSRDGVVDIVDQVKRKVERLDQVVHSAVYPLSMPVLDLSASEFNKALQVNGASLLYLVQEALPLLKPGSSVIFISSPGAKVVIRDYAALGTPKALAESLVRYLAVELGTRGVRVNIVSPSALPTDAVRKIVPDMSKLFDRQRMQTPLSRNPTFEDVAAAVSFLSSTAASMITGQEIVIDGIVS